MKRIAIVTATRAEYGLLLPVIKELRKLENENFRVDLLVTGTHLSDVYGCTIDEIIKDGIRIDYKLEIPVSSATELDICFNQAKTLEVFAKQFDAITYDGIVLLGDRYETLMVAIAAANMRIPIFHLYGGDTTEGAIDEFIRHSITKMSYMHFVSNENSRRRVIQLGEDPGRVFNYGATGTDNILNMELLPKEEALESVGLSDCAYAICTYHPVTMSDDDIEKKVVEFLDALTEIDELQFIITKSNADKGGALINSVLDREAEQRDNIHVFASLGIKRYLSLMKYSVAVVGNSSSGILEAPVFGIPTVNIGDRQRGRLQAESIINCGDSKEEILDAIRSAMLTETRERCAKATKPYGDGTASVKIAAEIYKTVNSDIDLMKKFYDL